MLKMCLQNGKKNMEYEIIISETCLEEIDETCSYIENVLNAELAANKLRKRIIEIILELKNSPRLYAKIEKTDRKGRTYRRIVIDKYVIIYTIIDDDKTILISHMYYSGRNYLDGVLL